MAVVAMAVAGGGGGDEFGEGEPINVDDMPF